MGILSPIRDLLAAWRYRRHIHQVATHYFGAGAVAPYAIAEHEMFLRRKLEDFRNFASRRYLEDRTLTLDDIKQEWLDAVVKPMARSQFTREDAKALKAAVQAIRHSEAFVGEARKAFTTDLRAASKAAGAAAFTPNR